jgi:hypothetical protein
MKNTTGSRRYLSEAWVIHYGRRFGVSPALDKSAALAFSGSNYDEYRCDPKRRGFLRYKRRSILIDREIRDAIVSDIDELNLWCSRRDAPEQGPVRVDRALLAKAIRTGAFWPLWFSDCYTFDSGVYRQFEGEQPFFIPGEFDVWSRRVTGGLAVKKRGRRKKYAEEPFKAAVIELLEHQGGISPETDPGFTQAHIVRRMEDWCAKLWGDDEPSNSWVRAKVSEAIDEFERKSRRK